MTLRFFYLELLVVVGLADGGGVPAKPLKKLLPGTLGTTGGPRNGGLYQERCIPVLRKLRHFSWEQNYFLRWDLAYRGWDLTERLERLTATAKVATVLSSIPASPVTLESEGRQMKQCWIKSVKNLKNSPVNFFFLFLSGLVMRFFFDDFYSIVPGIICKQKRVHWLANQILDKKSLKIQSLRCKEAYVVLIQ